MIDIRKIVLATEEIRHDGGPPRAEPVRRGWVAAVIRNRAVQREARIVALLAHLHAHEGTEAEAVECTREALVQHLGWPAAVARAVVLDGLDRGIVTQCDGVLRLSEAGRALARADAGRNNRLSAGVGRGGA